MGNRNCQAQQEGEAFAYEVHFNGPAPKRFHTDVPFFVLYCMVLLGWLCLGLWAIGKADPFAEIQSDAAIHARTMDMVATLIVHSREIITTFALVMVASLVVIFLMRWIVTPMLWFFTISLLLLPVIGGSYVYVYIKKSNRYTGRNDSSLGLYAGIWFAGVFFLLVWIAVVKRKHLKLAVALIKEGSRTVYSMWYTIFVPAIPCLLKIAAIAFGFKIAVSLSLQSRVAHSEMLTLHALNLLATLWTISFITALTEMILAGTFGAWYWTYDKEFVTSSALTTAVGRTVTYHLGTVAHGSLVITVCRMIRLTLRRVAQDRNSVAAACAYACFSCFERFLQRFNRNAYIMCAVHGRGLCTSALAAYQLIFRNVSRYVVTELVTDLAFGMCKVLIAVCAGCAVSASIDRPFWDKLDAIQIVVVGSYFIADTCFSVYEMAVATLVLCCLEDSERNDGSPERPYFMSKRLEMILAKRDDQSEESQPIDYGQKHLYYNNY